MCSCKQSNLELDSASKHYGTRRILSNVYLKVATGDICALFGRNGTGKSTLMKMIFGSVKADYMFLRICDNYIKCAFKHPELISYLPNDSFLIQNITIRKAFDLYNINIDNSDEILTRIYNRKVKELSHGECRYAEVFIALSTNSRFVLLDEPFNALPPLMIEKVKALITQKSKDKGIIIADHRYRDVLKITNRILLLKDETLYELENESELAAKGYILI